jgi:hypothetical protein
MFDLKRVRRIVLLAALCECRQHPVYRVVIHVDGLTTNEAYEFGQYLARNVARMGLPEYNAFNGSLIVPLSVALADNPDNRDAMRLADDIVVLLNGPQVEYVTLTHAQYVNAMLSLQVAQQSAVLVNVLSAAGSDYTLQEFFGHAD